MDKTILLQTDKPLPGQPTILLLTLTPVLQARLVKTVRAIRDGLLGDGDELSAVELYGEGSVRALAVHEARLFSGADVSHRADRSAVALSAEAAAGVVTTDEITSSLLRVNGRCLWVIAFQEDRAAPVRSVTVWLDALWLPKLGRAGLSEDAAYTGG